MLQLFFPSSGCWYLRSFSVFKWSWWSILGYQWYPAPEVTKPCWDSMASGHIIAQWSCVLGTLGLCLNCVPVIGLTPQLCSSRGLHSAGIPTQKWGSRNLVMAHLHNYVLFFQFPSKIAARWNKAIRHPTFLPVIILNVPVWPLKGVPVGCLGCQ